jgi:hypothetical protein
MKNLFARSDAGFAPALVLLLAAFAHPAAAAAAESSIPAEAAAQHVDEQAKVCGFVAGAKYAERTRGKPTFLDFGKPHPAQVFEVVIWETDRAKFKQPPEAAYDHKQVCVTGRIQLYRGTPQIVVRDPSQVALDDRAQPPS